MSILKFSNGKELSVSKFLTCDLNEDDKKLVIKIGEYKGFPSATTKMQDDYACFESVAFFTWSVISDCKVILEFIPYTWTESSLDYSNDVKMGHYMRFLYRASKMEELFQNRFEISDNNSDTVNKFRRLYNEALQNGELDYTEPTVKSSITKKPNVLENHLEKWFVMHGIEPSLIKKTDKFEPNIRNYFDQFPCDLFYKKERLFCGGAVDLWGIDSSNNQICIFELKRDGEKPLGIISELFFYSCVITDIIDISQKVGKRGKYRGSKEFWKVVNSKEIIHAYFLVPKFHSSIEEQMESITEEMNKRNDTRVEYGYIIFDQGEIIGDDKDAFIKRLNDEWNEYTYFD